MSLHGFKFFFVVFCVVDESDEKNSIKFKLTYRAQTFCCNDEEHILIIQIISKEL